MIYGENILSIQPADWSLINADMTSAIISLHEDSTATTEIKQTKLLSIPSVMLLSLIVDNYTNTYAPTAFAKLIVQAIDGTYFEYTVPLVEIKNNTCTVEINTTSTEYTSCFFSLFSEENIQIHSWALHTPVSDIVDLTEVEAKIPRLLADYNTSTITVSQREETIALISARLLENIDVRGQLQITYIASDACTITIRCKDNNGTELFTPLLFDVLQGKGSLGVPHAYLKRLLGLHTFTVTAQCTVGTLSFNTRDILYTIDAGYLAQRSIDIDTDIQDISVRRLATENSPSFIYAVGVDRDSIIRVRRRPYSEQGVVAWEHMYQYAEGTNAAIEFNGTWYRPIGQEYFTLLCEEHPWVFWIDLEGNLRAQYGPYSLDAFILATGVSQVKAVRGFKSEEFTEQDQGLVVVYIKSGLAYYRNYCIQSFGNYAWEEERELSQLGTDITDVHIHRLNDYRIGIVSSSPNGNKWLITTRMYIAGAVLPENIRSTIQDLAITVTALNYANFYTAEHLVSNIQDMYIGCAKPISPSIVEVTNIMNETTSIYVTFSNALAETLTDKQGYFTLTDDNNVSYQIVSTEVGESQSELVLTTENFAAAKNPMSLAYNNGITVDNLVPALTVISDSVHFAIPNTTISFEALKEPPTGYANENILVSGVSVTFVATQVYYKDRYGVENISANSNMVSIIVTNVGTEPL
jgi:hypothetical protein